MTIPWVQSMIRLVSGRLLGGTHVCLEQGLYKYHAFWLNAAVVMSHKTTLYCTVQGFGILDLDRFPTFLLTKYYSYA